MKKWFPTLTFDIPLSPFIDGRCSGPCHLFAHRPLTSLKGMLRLWTSVDFPTLYIQRTEIYAVEKVCSVDLMERPPQAFLHRKFLVNNRIKRVFVSDLPTWDVFHRYLTIRSQ